MALGQTIGLLNKLADGRISGTPWERTVLKGTITKIIDAKSGLESTEQDIFDIYKNSNAYTKFKKTSKKEINDLVSLLPTRSEFKFKYDSLRKDTSLGDTMMFMFNPTTWSRSTRSGVAQISIPGNKPIFHQAQIPAQKFKLQLLLDSSNWYNIDGVLSGLVDKAIGLIPYGREAQIYNIPVESMGPLYKDQFIDDFASLGKVIAWYESMARPDSQTKKVPLLFIVYQDLKAYCHCEGVTTQILRSDHKMNVNRAMLTLNFCVHKNMDLDD